MKNTFGNTKIINFATRKFEIKNTCDEELLKKINTKLLDLENCIGQYHEWAQEARKLDDEESAKHYETEAAKIESLIIKGKELLTEGHLHSIKRLEDEIIRLKKELNNGEKEFNLEQKEFSLEQIEDNIFRLQMDIDYLEDDNEIPQNEKEIKIDELKTKIADLESEKEKLKDSK
jgi:hypothetical protein